MKSVEPLKDGETIENLGDGYAIYQGENEFKFGTDAVKLVDFAVIKPGDKVMDLCSGTGIVPILLHKKEPNAQYTGLEIQEQMQKMAEKSVKLNNLTGKLFMQLGDVRAIRSLYPAESFQVVTCNPPYMKNETGKQNSLQSVTIARHEVCCTLADCMEAAAYLLPSGGRFYMVHRPERMADIMYLMRKNKLEPKRMTIFASGAKQPKLLVVEGQKNRNSGLILKLCTGEEQ